LMSASPYYSATQLDADPPQQRARPVLGRARPAEGRSHGAAYAAQDDGRRRARKRSRQVWRGIVRRLRQGQGDDHGVVPAQQILADEISRSAPRRRPVQSPTTAEVDPREFNHGICKGNAGPRPSVVHLSHCRHVWPDMAKSAGFSRTSQDKDDLDRRAGCGR